MTVSDDDVAMFVSMTSCGADEARGYLEMAGGNLQQAVSLFFEMGGAAGGGGGAPPPAPAGPGVIDSDVAAEVAAAAAAAGIDTGPLQPKEEVRAPIEAFQDQIINPEQERARMQEAIQADSAAMNRRMTFDRGEDGAGAGAGEADLAKKGSQAINQLFAAPEYNESDTYYQVIEKAKQESKWILVNIQQAEVFASHALNRDVWSDDTIKEIISGSFLFWQRDDKSHEGTQFCQYHQCGSQLPHICIVDPRTGRRLKSWDGRKWQESHAAAEFLFTFLDEHSMSRSPQGMSPMGSPAMMAQQDPAGAGDIRLTGLDSGAPAAEDVEMTPAKEPPSEMPEEPPEGGDVIKVSFRLPDGKRVTRRFAGGDTVEVMFRVASALAQEPMSLVDLATQYPKRSLREVEGGLDATLKDSQVANNMVLVNIRSA